jgi:hypothetical protein
MQGAQQKARQGEEQVIRVIFESALSTASTKEIKMINTLAESTLSTPIWLYIVTRSGGLWEFSSNVLA